jgi:hypothetical protein
MVVVLNCFQLAGALLYLTASSPIILIISRLVSGCGKCISVIFLVSLLDFLYRYHTGNGTYFWPLLEVQKQSSDPPGYILSLHASIVSVHGPILSL